MPALDYALASQLLVVLIPLLAVSLDLMMVIYFLQDLYKPERRVYGGDKRVWTLIIVFGSVLGCAAYLFIGRQA